MEALASRHGAKCRLLCEGEGRERVTGIEPATLCLASTRSSQLSYTRVGLANISTTPGSRVNRGRPPVSKIP